MKKVRRSLLAQLIWAKDRAFANAESFYAVGIKINGAVLSFLVTFAIARISGATVTGYYAMALVTVNMVATVGLIGLDLILIRVVAGELRMGRRDLAWAGLRDISRMVGFFSFVLSVLVFVLADFAPEVGVDSATMRAIAPAILANTLLRIAVVSLRADGSILFSQFLDSAHNITLVLVLGVYILASGTDFVSAATLALFYTGVLYFSMIVGWVSLLKRTRTWERGGVNTHPLLKSSWKVLVTGTCQAMTSWVIYAQLGALVGSGEVGAYRVAGQIVMTIQLMTVTLSGISAPEIAGHFRAGDLKGAWRTYRKTTILMIIAASVPSLICLLAPKLLLSIFGPEFVIAASALMIMALGSITSAAVGPMGTMTVMSGNEVLSMNLSILFLILAAAFAALLIPLFGLVGAAIASAIATIGRSLLTVIVLRKKLESYEAA